MSEVICLLSNIYTVMLPQTDRQGTQPSIYIPRNDFGDGGWGGGGGGVERRRTKELGDTEDRRQKDIGEYSTVSGDRMYTDKKIK
jgi:hypothetical protein